MDSSDAGPLRLFNFGGAQAAGVVAMTVSRGGPASVESIQGEAVKTGCVDTIVNDVKFFLNKYEHGESHRWN